jgi:hypothetical protein
MAKELPYFRFTVQDWQNGKISLESFELQGLFISVCGYYWINDCSITLAMLNKKFKDATKLFDELIKLDIIKHENKHDRIEIDFLNIQYDLLSEKRKRRQNAGSKGGNAKAMLKQKGSYKDKDKDNDNYKEKEKDKNTYRSFKHLTLSEFDFNRLINSGYTKIQIDDILDKIENWKGNNKYSNLYLTSLQWLKKEVKAVDPNVPKMVY